VKEDEMMKMKIIPSGSSSILTTYNYKYQGQERQDELGLNWDSFKWRNYDYAIGRFMCIDPLAEKYSYNGVYNFSENRVIDAIELEGLEQVKVTTFKQSLVDIDKVSDNEVPVTITTNLIETTNKSGKTSYDVQTTIDADAGFNVSASSTVSNDGLTVNTSVQISEPSKSESTQNSTGGSVSLEPLGVGGSVSASSSKTVGTNSNGATVGLLFSYTKNEKTGSFSSNDAMSKTETVEKEKKIEALDLPKQDVTDTGDYKILENIKSKTINK